MIGKTNLNLTRPQQVQRPETEDIKQRLVRLETQEVTTSRTAGLVKISVGSGEVLTIPSGYQYIVAEEFDVVGNLDIYGELVVI